MDYWFTLFSTVGVFSFIIIGIPWLAIASYQRDANQVFGASLALSLGAVCCLISVLIGGVL